MSKYNYFINNTYYIISKKQLITFNFYNYVFYLLKDNINLVYEVFYCAFYLSSNANNDNLLNLNIYIYKRKLTRLLKWTRLEKNVVIV